MDEAEGLARCALLNSASLALLCCALSYFSYMDTINTNTITSADNVIDIINKHMMMIIIIIITLVTLRIFIGVLYEYDDHHCKRSPHLYP